MAKDTAAVTETLFPTAKGVISSITERQSFKSSDGAEWFGIDVTMENGDTYSVWNTLPEALRQFAEGKELTYTKKLVVRNGRESYKLADFSFPIPRSERFEPLLVPKIADAVTYAASYAKDMCVAENSITNFETYAQRMYSWMKGTLLTENFE